MERGERRAVGEGKRDGIAGREITWTLGWVYDRYFRFDGDGET